MKSKGLTVMSLEKGLLMVEIGHGGNIVIHDKDTSDRLIKELWYRKSVMLQEGQGYVLSTNDYEAMLKICTN